MTPFEKDIKSHNQQRNKSIASNFSKGEDQIFTQEQFAELKKSNEVFTADNLNAFKADLEKAVESNELDADGLRKSLDELKELKIVRVENGGQAPLTFFVKGEKNDDLEKGGTKKGKEDELPE